MDWYPLLNSLRIAAISTVVLLAVNLLERSQRQRKKGVV